MITTMDALPEYCYECPCHNGEHGSCEADKERRSTFEYRPYWCPLKDISDEQEAVEGHRIVLEHCVKDTKDVVDKVIENLCNLSDDEPGVCRCAMKCPEHTNKNDI